MTIALCVPSIRPDALARLEESLQAPGDSPKFYKALTERAPNFVWAREMREWWIQTGADVCLTLQDDSIVAPKFWRILEAAMQHWPSRTVLGLTAVHPITSELWKVGQRWYRTRAWVIGWGYAMRHADVAEYHEWCKKNPIKERTTNEDTLINDWCGATQRDVWHPVVGFVDHNTSLESTYGNDHHTFRRPALTWRDVEADLTSPDFWFPSGNPPILGNPDDMKLCWHCLKRKPVAGSGTTYASICAQCLAQYVNDVFGRMQVK